MASEKPDYIFSMAEAGSRSRIVALGIGDMGRNAMENLARVEIGELELYSVNTDLQALESCQGSQPVQIGAARTRGKGTGGCSAVGRQSAEDDIEKIRGLVAGADLVFIAAGMGGGTGTGGAPVIAALCREMGILTIGTVTLPMHCEGQKRMAKAAKGLAELRRHVDSLVVIENEKLSMVMANEDVSIIEVFRQADKVLVDGVEAVYRIINSHGYINLDLADLRNVLKRPNDESCAVAFIGVGKASGPDRAVLAAMAALENPLLEKANIMGSENLLINVTGNEEMGLNEAHQAVQTIVDAAGENDREIFMGFVTDNEMGEMIGVTVIATAIENNSNVGLVGNRTSAAKQGTLHIADRGRSMPVSQPAEETLFRIEKIPDPVSLVMGVGPDNSIDAARIESFGLSPLVKRPEWLVPAYERRGCRHRGLTEPSQAAAASTDVRREVSTFIRTKRKNRRIYKEPALRMAC